MAEYCIDCFNKMNGTKLRENDVVLLKDFCEGCGKQVPCVVRIRSPLGRIIWRIFNK